MRVPSVVYSVIATVFIWVAVAMVRVIGGADSGMLDFALFAGLGASLAVWLVWAIVNIDASKNAAQQFEREKSKRAPSGEDARLSLLLLEMLDKEQRASLKQRLRGELSADGEAIALDDLLEDRRAR